MLETLRKKTNKILEEYKLTVKQVKSEKEKLEEATQHLGRTQKAHELVQKVSQLVQQRAHNQIAEVVSRCLQAVFDSPYKFQIIFERKRSKTEARLVFIKNSQEIDPTTSSGGGVIDVASFALRLSCLMLSKPKLRKVLLLDEPFRHLSANYRPRMSELLIKLSEEMDVQFIMVTHDQEFQVGKVIELA